MWFADYPPCVVNQSQCIPHQVPSYSTGQDQSPSCTTETRTYKTEQLLQSSDGNGQYQDLLHLAPSDYHVASPINDISGVGKQLDTTSCQLRESDTSVRRQTSRNCPSNDYSYPNHGAQWIQGHQYQYTADGYIIIQPDQYRHESHGNSNTVTANTEKCGSRGILDHTIWIYDQG
jgi:hypothetical protein